MTPAVFATIGLGLATIGLGIGVGLIGASAIQGMARQPEMSGKIQTVMFINIAIIEVVALLSAVVGFMAWSKG